MAINQEPLNVVRGPATAVVDLNIAIWDGTTGRRIKDGGILTSNIVTLNGVQILTNKTISGSLNTITNVSLTTGVTGVLPILNGGTGQTTANAALNAFLPSQGGNAGKFLTTDGSNTSWGTVATVAITSINADATAAQTLTTGTTGTDFAIVDNGTGDHKFNIPSASATARGLLTSAAFNSFTNKISTSLLVNKMIMGNTSNIATAGTVGGDVTAVWNAVSPEIRFTVTKINGVAPSVASVPNTVVLRAGDASIFVESVTLAGESYLWHTVGIADTSNNDSIRPTDRYLIAGDGSISLDWDNHYLVDTGNQISVDWLSKTLNDSSSNPIVDWANQILYDNTISLSADWSNRLLYDSTGAFTLNWENKLLEGDWTVTSLALNGLGGQGSITYISQSSPPSSLGAGAGFKMFADSIGRLSWINGGFVKTFDGIGNTANRIYTLPDTTGTVYVGSSGAAAPATNAIGVILDYYGTSATRVLTTPNSWATVLFGGTTYKIPLYT